MSMSNAAETAFLNLLLNNVAWTGIGDAGGLLPSATAGSFYIAMHTADPGEAGNQTTNEIAFTGYARVAVARSPGGWTVAGDAFENAVQVQYAQCTGGSGTASHFSIGSAASGTGQVLFKGALADPLSISNGITPLFAPGELSGVAN